MEFSHLHYYCYYYLETMCIETAWLVSFVKKYPYFRLLCALWLHAHKNKQTLTRTHTHIEINQKHGFNQKSGHQMKKNDMEKKRQNFFPSLQQRITHFSNLHL